MWKTGQINFNRAFLEEYKIAPGVYVLLFCDRDKKRIGVKFTGTKKELGAAKLIRKAAGASIFVRGFTNHYGIDCEKARCYSVRREEAQDLIVLEEEAN